MTEEIRKSVLGSVRLDSDVWEAVRGMGVSLNVYLRETLLGVGAESVVRRIGARGAAAEVYEDVKDLAAHLVKSEPEKKQEAPFHPRCLHCGDNFGAWNRNATVCGECKSAGHGGEPRNCGPCGEGGSGGL